MKIKLIIHGIPISKKAYKTYRNKKTGKIGTYSDEKQKIWENHIKLSALEYQPDKLFDGPLAVESKFFLLKPQSKSKKCVYPDTKPDHDNLEKSLYDGLEGIIYTNDSRIVEKIFMKRWGNPPRVEVTITEL